MEAQSLNSLNSRKRIVGILVTALLLLGIVVPITVLADEPFTIDTTLLSATDEPTSYAGGKDAAFAIDGDSIKLSYEIQGTRNGRKWEFSDESYKPVIGYSNKTVMEWFGPVPANQWRDVSVKLNGVELSNDTAGDSYYSVDQNWDSPGNPKFSLTIKPGVEIKDEFFATNQIEIVSTSDGETISVGTYVEEPSGPFSVDTTLMSATDEPTSYAGGKDAAFAIDGDSIKLSYEIQGTRNGRKWEFSDESYKPVIGYSNKTVMEWFGPVPANQWKDFVVKLNGVELSTETTENSYYSVEKNWDSPGNPKFSLTIKPGVEITDDFFATNKIEIVSTSDGETVTVGKYSGVTPDPGTDPEPLKSAKTITPAEDYRVPTEANENNNLQLKISNDNDMDWASKLTQVTYSYDEGTPVEMALGSGNISYPYSGDPYMSVDTGDIAAKGDAKSTILIGVRYSFFQNQNIPKGESREYTFTFKADGYEDSVVKQTIRNPKEVLEVAVNKGAKYSFALEDLQKMWKDEGSKEYTYSVYDTIPDVLEQEKHYGPTLKTVLAAAKIDLDSLADNDVIEFSTPSSISLGYKARITVKDLKEKRYAFPNGASPNKFKGTTAEQLEGKTEVPYIISLTGGENDLRNIFGQRDPQEEQKYDWVQYLGKITVYKGTATVYDGLTPSIESGSKVKEGDKLNFDFSTTGWQAGTASYAGIYYTVSTDGTEPADPTFSDIFYNYRQYGNPSYKDNPEYFNTYEFTNAEKTIIKAMIYIRGYAEPKIMTLTYTHDHAAAAAVKENEKAATCTEPGSYEEVVYCSECGTEISRETKTVEALGHTEVAIGEAKAATCTEAGITAGKKCSVCGETLEAQKELSALGHDWKVIPEVISTCTKKGSTAGVRCTRCGEYMLEPHEVPMIYHDYQNGKCTVCGAEDPDYKPDEPTPVEPDTKFTGLANEADKDGVWWYYTDGKIDKTHTGVDQNKYGWWRVENGKVNFNAQSIYQNQYGWWKTTDGEVTFKENSIYQNEYGWWKCKDSKVDFNAQSIYQNQYGWWKTTNGKVTFKEQGVYQNNYGWWKCKDSKVDFNANGKVTYNGKTYNVKNGKATLS